MSEESRSNAQIDLMLVERVQKGDKKAFDILVRKYQHKIINMAYQSIKDLEEAEDLAQDTFIKAYRALPNFRGDCAFYTWLYSIAVNNVRNYIQARARRPLSYDAGFNSGADGEPFESHHRLTDGDSPERLVLTAEIAETIRRTLDELPEELRIALMLREFEGLSYEEIATAMGCPIGTVRSRIFRAREAIDNGVKGLLG